MRVSKIGDLIVCHIHKLLTRTRKDDVHQCVESRFSRVHDPWWKSQDFLIQEFIFILCVVVQSGCCAAVGPHTLLPTALPMELGSLGPRVPPRRQTHFLSDLMFGFRWV